jgi:hypothetical protein
MNISEVLTLIFGLATTILGILLKAEYDKRTALQKRVAEQKRNAYTAFDKSINEMLAMVNKGQDMSKASDVAKQLTDLRQGIW